MNIRRKNTHENNVNLIHVQIENEINMTFHQPMFSKYSVSEHGNTKPAPWSDKLEEYIFMYTKACACKSKEVIQLYVYKIWFMQLR